MPCDGLRRVGHRIAARTRHGASGRRCPGCMAMPALVMGAAGNGRMVVVRLFRCGGEVRWCLAVGLPWTGCGVRLFRVTTGMVSILTGPNGPVPSGRRPSESAGGGFMKSPVLAVSGGLAAALFGLGRWVVGRGCGCRLAVAVVHAIHLLAIGCHDWFPFFGRVPDAVPDVVRFEGH